MTEAATALSRPDAAPRRRRKIWLAGALVIVLIAVGVPSTVWFVHWRSSLHPLTTYPVYGATTPLALGRTTYFGENLIAQEVFDHPHSSGELSLDVRMVAPVVRENTADADITVLRCVLASHGGGPVAEGRAATAAACVELTKFAAGPIHIGFARGDDDIVLAVTPHHVGRVRISGLQLRFNAGLRHGTQHVGGQLGTVTS